MPLFACSRAFLQADSWHGSGVAGGPARPLPIAWLVQVPVLPVPSSSAPVVAWASGLAWDWLGKNLFQKATENEKTIEIVAGKGAEAGSKEQAVAVPGQEPGELDGCHPSG